MKSSWIIVGILCCGMVVSIASAKQVGQKQREEICHAVAQLEQAMEEFDVAKILELFSDTNTEDCIKLAEKSRRLKERFIEKGKDPADFEVDISVHGVSVVSNMYLACGVLYYAFEGREMDKEAVQILFNNIGGRYTIESISCPFNEIRNLQVRNKKHRSAVLKDDLSSIENMSESAAELFGPAGAKKKDKHFKHLPKNKQDEWFEYIADNEIIDSPDLEIIRSSKFGDTFFIEARVFNKGATVKQAKGYLVLLKCKEVDGEMNICEMPLFLGKIKPEFARE